MENPIAKTHQIHGVQPVQPVPDVGAATRWFCAVLGFSTDFSIGEPPSYARVRLGDRSWGDPVYIHLRQAEEGDGPACGETRLHAGHDIDGLHAHVLAQLAVHGGEVLEPPTDQPWGLREFTLRGPGGHRFVIGAESGPHDAAGSPGTDAGAG